MSVLEKRTVSFEELDKMAAVELPEREMLSLVTVVITNVLNHLTVRIPIQNNHVAVQICAVVNILNNRIGTDLTCHVRS
jgi:hypothetical protein